MIRKIGTFIAGAGLVLAITSAASTTAAATEATPAATAGSGNLFAYRDPNFGGTICAFFNSDSNWGDNCGNFRNVASAVWNDTAHGNSANLYFHPGYTGAWACLHAGDYWYDLSAQGVIFSWGPGRDGYGTSADNEIASSKWIAGNFCDNNHS